jgi:ankyrin repeat protein
MTSLMAASFNGHVEAVRVLIEKGANLEAANKVRIHSHATTHARSQTLTHTRMHTLAYERTI